MQQQQQATTTSTPGSKPGGGGSKTFTIGLLYGRRRDRGPPNGHSVLGVKAGIGVAATMGYKIKYVVADTATSSPTGALSGAQTTGQAGRRVRGHRRLRPVLFGGALPHVQPHSGGRGGLRQLLEWLLPTSYNMFSVIGNQDFTKVYTTTGLFLKSQGVTNVGSIGYSVSPSSAVVARASAVSAEAQGIKFGYLNDSFPFGSTNVGPVALAMKSAGVNALVADTEPSTVFALATALQQQGVHLKATVLPTGGGVT